MRTFKIPLTPDNQIFNIHLGAKHYLIELRWNAETQLWAIDIADFTTKTPLVNGIPLITGANLLDQFEYLEIPGQLIVLTEDNKPPGYNDLGSDSAGLYFYSDEDYPYGI